MIKIAFFVEGQTERIFLESLLNNYFTHPYFNVESYQIIENKATLITKAFYDHPDIRLSFLIFDVTGDGNVNGAIYDRSESLIKKSGYSHIFGIRDLFPNKKEEIESIKEAFEEVFGNLDYFKQLTQIIAIMEIEAWFLADYDHFSRINPVLTTDWINDELEIDLINDNIEDYPHPAEMINRIWQLVGGKYRKRESDSYSICSHLDYYLYCCDENLQSRIPSFKELFDVLDEKTS